MFLVGNLILNIDAFLFPFYLITVIYAEIAHAYLLIDRVERGTEKPIQIISLIFIKRVKYI